MDFMPLPTTLLAGKKYVTIIRQTVNGISVTGGAFDYRFNHGSVYDFTGADGSKGQCVPAS